MRRSLDVAYQSLFGWGEVLGVYYAITQELQLLEREDLVLVKEAALPHRLGELCERRAYEDTPGPLLVQRCLRST